MKIKKLDAATTQLATAIRLYFEDRDPVSVHTLAMAAGEIIDRICAAKGCETFHIGLLARVVPERRKEVRDALNKPRNFFKHADKADPNEELEEFSDDRNFVGLLFASHALHLLGVSTPETKVFGAWLALVEPHLLLTPLPHDQITVLFGDIQNQPRNAQKRIAHDALHFMETGKLPDTGVAGPPRRIRIPA